MRPDEKNELYDLLRRQMEAFPEDSLCDAARRLLDECDSQLSVTPIGAPIARRVIEASELEGEAQWEALRQAVRGRQS